MQEPLCQLQHRVRDSLRCHSSRQLEARRPITFGGLGDGADGPACRAALRAASTELEKSLLRGLLAGAMWTAARVSGHGTRANAACPHCGAATVLLNHGGASGGVNSGTHPPRILAYPQTNKCPTPPGGGSDTHTPTHPPTYPTETCNTEDYRVLALPPSHLTQMTMHPSPCMDVEHAHVICNAM